MEVETEPIDCKVVVVGDSKCGKSALISKFTSNRFTEVYVPTNFDKRSVCVPVDEIPVKFSIWDTSGSASHDPCRHLAYPDAHVFLACFDIGDPDSLDSLVDKWYPEIRSCSSAPIVLCGCKKDLRNDIQTIGSLADIRKIPVTSEQARAITRKVGGAKYIETSARNSCCHFILQVVAQIGLGNALKKPPLLNLNMKVFEVTRTKEKASKLVAKKRFGCLIL